MFERYFTAIVLLGSAMGVLWPEGFLWLKPYIPVLLGVVMFGIGLTLRWEQLVQAAQPVVIVLAAVKFLLMPLLAYSIALALQLPPEGVIGMVILGACPGGVSANLMSYLARADVSLAVVLTIATTLMSPLVTPLVIYLALHAQVEIALAAMMHKLFWVVLFPLLDALVVRRFFSAQVQKVAWVFPPLSMLAVALILAFVTAVNRELLLTHPWLTVLAVLLFNLGGYALGYGIARLARLKCESCRAVGFEFGIQDSALGVILATGFFTGASALASGLCSVIQNLTGPMLARWYAKHR